MIPERPVAQPKVARTRLPHRPFVASLSSTTPVTFQEEASRRRYIFRGAMERVLPAVILLDGAHSRGLLVVSAPCGLRQEFAALWNYPQRSSSRFLFHCAYYFLHFFLTLRPWSSASVMSSRGIIVWEKTFQGFSSRVLGFIGVFPRYFVF